MKRLTLILTFLCMLMMAYAQKPALDHSVYDSWKTFKGVSIPRHGDILMYTMAPAEGDVVLVVENIRTGKRFEVPRATQATLSRDEAKVIALIKPLFKQTREAKIKKQKEMPKDTLAVIDVKTGDVKKFPNHKSYAVPSKLTSHIAFELSPEKEKPAAKSTKPEGEAKKAEKKEKKAEKKELYVMNIVKGEIDTLKNVASYKFNKEGDLMAYVVEPEKKDSLGKVALYLYTTATGESKEVFSSPNGSKINVPQFNEKNNSMTYVAEPDAKDSLGKVTLYFYKLDSGENREVLSGPKGSKIRMPEFSKVGTMAFYANIDTAKAAKNDVEIYLYNIASGELKVAANNKMEGLRKGWIVSENASLSFSEDGKRLFFGTAPKPLEKDTTLADFEQPQLDIWSWHDDYLQPMQLLKRDKDLKKTYTAYINTSLNDNFVQLGDLDVPHVGVPNKKMADWAIIGNDKAYRIQSQWDYNRMTDLYLVNVQTGERKLILKEACLGGMSVSPNGEWAVMYDKITKAWFQYTIATGEMKDITSSLGVAFHNEDHDTPNLAGPYGFPQWFKDNSAFIINDRFDYWKFDPKGEVAPMMITDSYGRKNNSRLSILKLITDPDEEEEERSAYWITGKEPLYFTTFNFKTKETGLAIKDFSKKKAVVTKLVEGPYAYSNFFYSKPGKGKKPVYVYVRGNFEDGFDLYMSVNNFKVQKKISDINPQQREYNWGTVELINWRTMDDIFCEGLLFKPEDFDPNKKYPVMIYFYEKESKTLYNPRIPAGSRSVINIPYFVSNGYVVFVPDIYYNEGHPGQSAMRSIMPAVEMLEKNYPWIDGKNMAIQGQSWGGYQVAYMITQTDKFKAAGAGAPVVNMTSAYGGIRWGSGITRQMQYEHGQSRIGKDLWSGYELYYENSPLFFIPNVKTPVLIMHNDKDGAVPWYQGIEFFAALRRCGKIAWMLQYNNEEHNLMHKKNFKDLSIRLSQFFDHYLKGAPMPKWMKYGRPATEKGFDLGYDLVE